MVPDELGKPSIHVLDKPGQHDGQVTLSHTNGLAIAAACMSDMFSGIGIDIEKVEERTDSWIQDYFTEREQQVAQESNSPWRMLTRMWSLKEASLKALGTGLRFDLKEIEIVNLYDGGTAEMQFSGEARDHFQNMAPGSLEAWWEDRDGMVIARVIIRK